MAAIETPNVVRTYGNWRQPVSAGLLGLGKVGTAILLGGLLFGTLLMMTAGILAAFIFAVVLIMFLAFLLVKDSDGKSALARSSTRIGWWAARAQGANVYRSGPTGQTPWGTNQLPGLAAGMRLSEHVDSYNRPFALLYTPATATFSVVIGTEPSGAVLVDGEQIDVWVADWGHWLAQLADEAGVESASVTIETAPDSGERLRREVQANMDPTAPAFARATLAQAVEGYPAGSSVVRAYVAITFRAAARPGGRRRKPDEMARELASRLPGLTQTLQATGAGAAHPVTAQQLCELVRVAYDPIVAPLIDNARLSGDSLVSSWADAGPSAAQASWSSYRHDSGHSVTWSMTRAPHGHVQSGVLARLLAPRADIARKRVTLLYRPIPAGRAAGMVEADLAAAQFRSSASAKPSARDTLAVSSAAQTAREEASGAGLVNFGMLVTATMFDPAEEADVSAAIDNLSAGARLRLRRVYGSQDSAFAAALPLGLVLPKHIKIPSELRSNL